MTRWLSTSESAAPSRSVRAAPSRSVSAPSRSVRAAPPRSTSESAAASRNVDVAPSRSVRAAPSHSVRAAPSCSASGSSRNVDVPPSRSARAASSRRRQRGLTLIELMISMAILSFISITIYQAMDGMRRSREGVNRVADRYREGRIAMRRITRELQSAYLSNHAPIDDSLRVVDTAFIGERDTPASVLHFNSFSNRRLRENSRVTDQVEISYFGSEDPDRPGVIDLARRENPRLDDKPDEGGRVDVLATNIDLFDLEYLDPLTGKWRDEWDSTSVVGEKGLMPLQVKVILVLNEGVRARSDSGRGKVRLVTKVPIPIQDSLNFALK